MERRRLSFADVARPDRSGALLLDDRGTITLRASPALALALDSAVGNPSVDLAPIRFDDHARGLALVASLVRGVPARLLECEFASGAFELRAFIRNGRVRMTIRPGDFDPDAAWEFIQAVNEAKLEAPRA
ncbi:MAG TPA: hypothetical protein VGR51_09960 [Thermoplasmata archaeon]|nr:hypothetical protein [Thermoplasmata archaeon]